MGLELYARIEPLLGFDEEAARLHRFYVEILSGWQPRRLLDIGCGSGAFLAMASERLGLERALGIDLSETMVARARQRGVAAEVKDLCEVKERFDAATAVFDVLNYLPAKELERFLGCVSEMLEPGGIFLADVNTLYGFEEVAPGAFVRSDEGRFLAVEADFGRGELRTRIDCFTREGEACWRREADEVVQYYHDPTDIAALSGSLELAQSYPLTMFGDEPDKEVLLFVKR